MFVGFLAQSSVTKYSKLTYRPINRTEARVMSRVVYPPSATITRAPPRQAPHRGIMTIVFTEISDRCKNDVYSFFFYPLSVRPSFQVCAPGNFVNCRNGQPGRFLTQVKQTSWSGYGERFIYGSIWEFKSKE